MIRKIKSCRPSTIVLPLFKVVFCVFFPKTKKNVKKNAKLLYSAIHDVSEKNLPKGESVAKKTKKKFQGYSKALSMLSR